MAGQPIVRSTYRDPTQNGNPVRTNPGVVTDIENARDMEQYYAGLESAHVTAAHGAGVAAGLRVSATTNTAVLAVSPGVALDANGRHICLTAGGSAEIGPNADNPNQAPTLTSVAADTGAQLETTGLSAGDYFLTIQFWETFDSRSHHDDPTVYSYLHTPWLRLLPASNFTSDDTHLILARVSLDAHSDLTALAADGRHPTTLPAQALELRTPTATTSGSALQAGDTTAGELASRPDGGLQLTVEGPQPLIIQNNGQDGILGVGTGTPRNALGIRAVQASEELLSFENRAGQTVWHVNQNFQNKSGLNFAETGVADARLYLQAGGRVGINTTSPQGRLHAQDAGGFGGEDGNGVSTGSNVPLLAQSDSTAIGVLNAQGRPAFALNIDNNAGTPNARGVPTLYDRYDGRHSAISIHNGQVGIGTQAPTSQLQVQENVLVGGRIGVFGQPATPVNPDLAGGIRTWVLEAEGTIWCANDVMGKRFRALGADIPEHFIAAEALEPGDVVALDQAGDLRASRSPRDRGPIGVVSGAPGVRLNDPPLSDNARLDDARTVPVALCGQGPRKVNNDNGVVRPGDILVTSFSRGYAM